DDEETESDGESEEEETMKKEEESFDPILRTPEESEDDGNRMESIFTTGSSFVTPIPSPKSTMTPSIMTTTTTASQPPIPPTPITSDILQTLLTFTSVKSQVKAQVTRILPRIEESVNAQLEAEVLTRSSHSSRTSYAVAADLSEMELKKILIDKMEGNKSTQGSDEQQNLYKALVDAYEADKTILDSYGESAILKRRRENDDDQEGPSAGSDRGSKRQREGGEHASASTPSEPATGSAGRSTTGTQSRQMSASESAFAEEPVQTTCQIEEPSHPVFKTCAEDQPIVQTSQQPEWFSQPRRPPTPDRDWNKTFPAAQGNAQSWISALAKQTDAPYIRDLARQIDARSSFNELLDTPIDFSNFIMHRLNIDTLTPDLLAGPTYELMRGSCTSLTELEYHLEEVYKATTDQLDWVNPEGGEQASASTPSEKETEGAGRTTQGSQSRQMSASESAFAEEPIQTTCQMEEPPHPPRETTFTGSCLEYNSASCSRRCSIMDKRSSKAN
nr:hypothetical protein [Tanacetum cinerariifolium]